MSRIIAIAVSVALLATLAVVSIASGAPPTCHGLSATKVGTAGNDYIKGTAGRDVIVARGGNDKIVTLGGNDVICAGSGKDLVLAGAGKDLVFGQFGNDILKGGDQWDVLNGGPGADKCVPGGGGARLVGCEGADLRVNAWGPDSAQSEAEFWINVRVKNVGAKATRFDLDIESDPGETPCGYVDVDHPNQHLKPGWWLDYSYSYECTWQGSDPDPAVTLSAEATAVSPEDSYANNSSEHTVAIEPTP